jgi:hypothetical protein
VDFLIQILNWLGTLTFVVLSICSPAVSLTIISALLGVLMLWMWGKTSNQDAIANVRRQIAAHLLATRLFKDDLSVTFRAQRQIVWQAIKLLGYSLRPMIIMMIPFVLLMSQIGLWYEHQPLKAGKPFRVKITMKDGARVEGIGEQMKSTPRIKTDRNDPCRVKALRTVDWRLTADAPGRYEVTVGTGADTVAMPVNVGAGFLRLSRMRGGSAIDRLLYSAEPSIPASSAFESIEVIYPARSTPILGFDVHWLITLFVLSIVFALLAKPFMKVHI